MLAIRLQIKFEPSPFREITILAIFYLKKLCLVARASRMRAEREIISRLLHVRAQFRMRFTDDSILNIQSPRILFLNSMSFLRLHLSVHWTQAAVFTELN